MLAYSAGKKILLLALLQFMFFAQGRSSVPLRDSVRLKEIIINYDSVIPGPAREKIILSNYENTIAFEYEAPDNVQFRFYLDGFDTKWAGWKNQGIKEYTNLPAGNFTLKVRIKQNGEPEKELVPVHIRVLPVWYVSGMALIVYLILLCLILWATYAQLNLRFARKQYLLEQIINKRTEDLIIEKEKSENLLANVLPRNTASEIMSKGKATKIKYNFVTVLFSDIQGFTRIAEEMNPEVLIDELDKFFFYFDSVVEKYGIEKIKTIGDAYMCAGGIPEKNRTNPVEVILAAIEMQKYMNRLKESSELQGMKYWDIRIGIHTGTVVAGVVGQKKLSYDIWGDTVNTASRMESSGEAGKINISGTTYEFVKEFFTCEYRGKMPVKYKGELEMYFVNGIVPELCDENGLPNKMFITKIQMIKLSDIEEMVIKLFDDEASPNLYFHNSAMVKNICNHIELLATAKKIPADEYIRLKLAAIFLLSGYIYTYENPMESSLRLAAEILPKYGFTQEDIDLTSEIIRNSYNEKYLTLTDRILHDARYDYLGRVDYPRLTEKLLRERTEYGKHTDQKTWISMQKTLLAEHDFFTDTAKLLRSVSIEEQIQSLQSSK